MDNDPFLCNRRIERVQPLISPQEMLEKIPISETSYRTALAGRKEVEAILDGSDNRFLLIAGPCSIHDPVSALDYASRLVRLRKKYRDGFCIIMRTYFEKPRSGLGWRGLIVEPEQAGLVDVVNGLETARKTLNEITALGLPVAAELLDPIVPQYIADFISWASIGARSAESQVHRELASGLSMPVGFKNPTDGNIDIAVNAIVSARASHAFLGIMQNGLPAAMLTSGNEYAHLVLRGSVHGINYDRVSVETSCRVLAGKGIKPSLLIDCSHGNSQRNPDKQQEALFASLRFRFGDMPIAAVRGCMLESFIQGGTAPLGRCAQAEDYGKSVTDSCMSWDATEAVLAQADALWRSYGKA